MNAVRAGYRVLFANTKDLVDRLYESTREGTLLKMLKELDKIPLLIVDELSINDPEKKEQEIASLIRIPDSFKKIVVVKDYVKPWWDDNGIQYVGIEDFLLDESLISG